MSIAAPNIPAEYYRSARMSYAQTVGFLKTNNKGKETSESENSANSGKVVLPQDIGASQKSLSEPLYVAADIRRFSAQSQSEVPLESKSEPLNRFDAHAEKAAVAMVRNARKRKPVFQSDRKPLSFLA